MQKVWYSVLMVMVTYTYAQEPVHWGCSDRQGCRPTMEDACVYHEMELNAKKYSIFGLFDGHGGSFASAYAAKYLKISFEMDCLEALKQINDHDKALTKGLFESCKKIDNDLYNHTLQEGTTALIAVYGDHNVHLAWAGDSRGLVINDQGAIKASTIDHKPDSQDELKRIGIDKITCIDCILMPNGLYKRRTRSMKDPVSLKPGHTLVSTGPARLCGLAVSRSLGDHWCKQQEPLIIAVPDVLEVPVCDGDYLILACDGLWDVMSSLEAAEFVKERLSWTLEAVRQECLAAQPASDEKSQDAGSHDHLRLIASALRNKAYALKSTDNISVMIVKL